MNTQIPTDRLAFLDSEVFNPFLQRAVEKISVAKILNGEASAELAIHEMRITSMDEVKASTYLKDKIETLAVNGIVIEFSEVDVENDDRKNVVAKVVWDRPLSR